MKPQCGVNKLFMGTKYKEFGSEVQSSARLPQCEGSFWGFQEVWRHDENTLFISRSELGRNVFSHAPTTSAALKPQDGSLDEGTLFPRRCVGHNWICRGSSCDSMFFHESRSSSLSLGGLATPVSAYFSCVFSSAYCYYWRCPRRLRSCPAHTQQPRLLQKPHQCGDSQHVSCIYTPNIQSACMYETFTVTKSVKRRRALFSTPPLTGPV